MTYYEYITTLDLPTMAAFLWAVLDENDKQWMDRLREQDVELTLVKESPEVAIAKQIMLLNKVKGEK